jgi:hypothetical protein
LNEGRKEKKQSARLQTWIERMGYAPRTLLPLQETLLQHHQSTVAVIQEPVPGLARQQQTEQEQRRRRR